MNIRATIVAGALLSAGAMANEQMMQQMLDSILTQAEESAQQTCNDKEFLRCAEISSETCLKVSKAVYDQCLSKLTVEVMMNNDEAVRAEFEQCPDRVATEHGLDMNKVSQCDSLIPDPSRP